MKIRYYLERSLLSKKTSCIIYIVQVEVKSVLCIFIEGLLIYDFLECKYT